MSGEDGEGPLPRKWQLGKERLGRQELRRAIQKLLRLVAGRPLCRAVYWFARASAAANVTPWGKVPTPQTFIFSQFRRLEAQDPGGVGLRFF